LSNGRFPSPFALIPRLLHRLISEVEGDLRIVRFAGDWDM